MRRTVVRRSRSEAREAEVETVEANEFNEGGGRAKRFPVQLKSTAKIGAADFALSSFAVFSQAELLSNAAT